jgi:hypothetical protein
MEKISQRDLISGEISLLREDLLIGSQSGVESFSLPRNDSLISFAQPLPTTSVQSMKNKVSRASYGLKTFSNAITEAGPSK